MQIVAGDKVEVTCAAKGGGSENKSKLAMLNPSDDIVDWVLKPSPQWVQAGVHLVFWVLVLVAHQKKQHRFAKESLMSHIDIHKLKQKPTLVPSCLRQKRYAWKFTIKSMRWVLVHKVWVD